MSFDTLLAQVDRAAMAALGGESVTYTPAVGSPVTIVTGLFDAQFVLAKGDAHAGVESFGPAVFVRLEDLPTDPETDDPTLTIRGVNYRVIERIPDNVGTFGGVTLVLRSIT